MSGRRKTALPVVAQAEFMEAMVALGAVQGESYALGSAIQHPVCAIYMWVQMQAAGDGTRTSQIWTQAQVDHVWGRLPPAGQNQMKLMGINTPRPRPGVL